MSFFNTGWKRYLLITPILLLLGSAFVLHLVTENLRTYLVTSRYSYIANEVRMLNTLVDKAPIRNLHLYINGIVSSIEQIDRLEQTYGSVYKTDGTLVSTRFAEADILAPFDFPEFTDRVKNSTQGTYVFSPNNKKHSIKCVHAYWWRGPSWLPEDQQIIVIGGTSEYTKQNRAIAWMTLIHVANILLTLIVTLWAISTIVMVGKIRSLRCKQDRSVDAIKG